MENIFLFGSGNNAYGVIPYLRNKNILAIVDNEKKKQGNIFFNIPIISFSDYLKIQRGERVVITAAICDEIIELLEKNGIYNYTIAPMIVMGMAEPEQIVNEWRIAEKADIYFVGFNIITEKFCEYMRKNYPAIHLNMVAFSEEDERVAIKNKIKWVCVEQVDKNVPVLLFKEKLLEEEKQILNQFSEVLDVFQLMPEKNYKFLSMIQKLKNKHRNEKCFIIGNGPSLQIGDLENIQRLKIPSFGMNLIYGMYESTTWRPTYYVITECEIYHTYLDDIKHLRHDNLFVKNFYDLSKEDYIKDVIYYPGYARRSYYEEQKISGDISKVVYAGYSVLFDSIQIALYMGFNEIYLIGADFSYKGDPRDKGNHIYDNVLTDKRTVASKARVDITYHALEVAKEYAERQGVKIYNATRGGNLEVFPRIELDKILTT